MTLELQVMRLGAYCATCIQKFENCLRRTIILYSFFYNTHIKSIRTIKMDCTTGNIAYIRFFQ